MIDYRRASIRESHLFSNKELLEKKTSLVAEEDNDIVATLQYRIINFNDAEITLFKSSKYKENSLLFEGFVDEILYWNPYLDRIDISTLSEDDFLDFKARTGYKLDAYFLMTNSKIDVVKVLLEEIIPEQLTVDENKLSDVSRWIRKPEDVVVSCVIIEGRYVCIDGHSRLVEAYLRGFKYVYLHLDEGSDIELYKTCLKWCREDGIHSIKDLSLRVVCIEEHQSLWINRCQAYLDKSKTNA